MSGPDARPTGRRLGDGYEPHVDEVDGRLVYSIPVDSGFASASFAFGIEAADLGVLIGDPYRRAVLRWVLHTVLQRSMGRGEAPVTQADFRRFASTILFAPPDAVAELIEATSRTHHIHLQGFIDDDLARTATS